MITRRRIKRLDSRLPSTLRAVIITRIMIVLSDVDGQKENNLKNDHARLLKRMISF